MNKQQKRAQKFPIFQLVDPTPRRQIDPRMSPSRMFHSPAGSIITLFFPYCHLLCLSSAQMFNPISSFSSFFLLTRAQRRTGSGFSLAFVKSSLALFREKPAGRKCHRPFSSSGLSELSDFLRSCSVAAAIPPIPVILASNVRLRCFFSSHGNFKKYFRIVSGDPTVPLDA